MNVSEISKAVNPSWEFISQDERNNYFQDYEKEIKNHPKVIFETATKAEGKVRFPYEKITVCALKPLKAREN